MDADHYWLQLVFVCVLSGSSFHHFARFQTQYRCKLAAASLSEDTLNLMVDVLQFFLYRELLSPPETNALMHEQAVTNEQTSAHFQQSSSSPFYRIYIWRLSLGILHL